MSRRLRRAGAVVALYVALVGWLTWPLALHLTSELPDAHGACRFDLLSITWILSTESQNLAGERAHLLAGTAYHPEDEPLAYGSLAVGALPLFAPAFLASRNPALAANLLFTLGVALSAASLHLVARRWTGSHAAGFIAALTFLTDRWVLWEFVPTAPFYAALVCFPIILDLVAESRSGAGWTILLAALVALQALADQVYVAPAVLAPLGAIALVRLLRASRRRDGLRLLVALGLAGLAIAPFYAPYLRVRQAIPNLTAESVWGANAEPVPLDRALWGFQSTTAIAPAAAAVIAIGLALRLVAARRQRARSGSLTTASAAAACGARQPPTAAAAWRVCAAFVGIGLLLALPRTLWLAGRAVAMPWFGWLEILGHLRANERSGVAALFGLALASGLGFAECARALTAARRTRTAQVVAAGLAALVGVTALRQYERGFGRPAYARGPLPAYYPLQKAIRPDDPLVAALRAGAGPLVELPLGPFDVLPPAHARAMYRSILHGRPILNGYSSYLPPGFRERMALAARLPDESALRELRRNTGLAQILVETGEVADPEKRAAWLAIAEHGGRDDLVLTARDGTTLLFDVRTPAGAQPVGS